MIGEDGKAVFRAFSFSNSTDGGESLLAKLTARGVTPETVEIKLEATGHYWLAVCSFPRGKGFTLHVINPIQTDGWQKGVEIRRVPVRSPAPRLETSNVSMLVSAAVSP